MKINIVLPSGAKQVSGGFKIVFEYANYLSLKGYQINIYYILDNLLQRRNLHGAFANFACWIMANYYPRWFKLEKRIKTYGGEKNKIKLTEADVTIATAVETFDIVNNQLNSKKVYFIQDYENWNVSDTYLKKTYQSNVKKITIAKWLSKIVEKYSPTKCICIPDGIDSKIFYKSEVKKIPHSIVFHYRKASYKGCDIALKVLEKLKSKYNDLTAYAVSNENIDHLPDWIIKKKRIPPREVAKINNYCEVFLCTSRKEGYGLPGLESMACGCALVSTSYQGVLEYAIDKENALLAPVDDVDGLIDNIVNLFENQELRNKIVMGGLKTARELTIENSAKKFEEVLIDLVKETTN